MAELEKKAAPKKSAVKPKAADKRKPLIFSNPFFMQDVKVSSTPAQAVFSEGFERCDTALRSLSVVLPVVLKSESEIMSVNGAVEHILNGAFRELRNEQARITKIAEDNGIEIGKLGYTNVVSFQAKISCGKAGQYLQLIRELDKLVESIHATWLIGFIADDAKSALERQWRRKAMSVVIEIETIAKRAFEAAQKSKSAAVVVDPADKSTDAEKIVGETTNTEPAIDEPASAVLPESVHQAGVAAA